MQSKKKTIDGIIQTEDGSLLPREDGSSLPNSSARRSAVEKALAAVSITQLSSLLFTKGYHNVICLNSECKRWIIHIVSLFVILSMLRKMDRLPHHTLCHLTLTHHTIHNCWPIRSLHSAPPTSFTQEILDRRRHQCVWTQQCPPV